MRIGILTHPLETNYGGIVQNFALQTILKELGHSPITLDYKDETPLKIKILSFIGRIIKRIKGKSVPLRGWMTKSEKYYISKNTYEFIQNYIHTTPTFPLLKMGSISKKEYDALIVGSDQVWRGGRTAIEKFFFSDFQDVDIPKIAYAASMGADWWSLTKKETKICKSLAQKFKAISVREDNAIQLCKENLDVEAVHVLDPTMLIDRKYYVDIVENKNVPPLPKGTLMTYVLDKEDKKEEIINCVSKKLCLKKHTVMAKSYFQFVGHKYIVDCVFPPIQNWLRGFIDAEYVVTDSFHGTVFSVIFNKPFITIVNQKRGAGRFVSLLGMLGLENRMVNSIEEAEMVMNKKIDWQSVNAIVQNKRIESIEFLKNNLV